MPSRNVFLPIIFNCFARQYWTYKELLIVDEGENTPIPSWAKRISVPLGTSIGAKLNIGVESSDSNFYMKWDDDDWRNPSFIHSLIRPLETRSNTVSAIDTHLVFLVKEWRLHITDLGVLGGGSISFDRKAWEHHPFDETLRMGEEVDFLRGKELFHVTSPPWTYVLVRHGNNTWNSWKGGGDVDEAMGDLKLLGVSPEEFFPFEDLKLYKSLRR
jgi:hypothetical protein